MIWTIGKRISAALLLLLTLFIGTVLSFMIVYGNMRQEYDSIFNDVTSNIILIKDLSNAVHEQNLNIQGFVLTGRQQHLQAIQTWHAKMLEILEKLKTSIHDETLLQQLGTVRLMLAQYERTLDFIVLVRREKGIAAAERYLEYGDFLAKAEQELHELVRLSSDRASQFMARSSAAVSRLHIAFGIIFLFSITVAIVIAVRIRSLIMAPLQNLVAGARSIAQGNFDCPIAITESSEFTEVGNSFNIMAASLKQAFGELAQGEQKYRELADLLPMIVYEVDSRGYYTYVNQAAYTLTGYTAEDVEKGLHSSQLIPKDYHHQLVDGLKRLMAGETLLNREYMLRCKDGSILPCLFFSAPIIKKGSVVGARGSILNIADLKQAEEALKKSERKFRGIFDQSYQYMAMLAPDGTLLSVNRAALSLIGAKEQDVIGRQFWQTPWWTHSAAEQEKLKKGIQTAAQGEFVRFETTHCSHEGTTVYVDFSLKPVKDEAGLVASIIPEGRDITGMKQAEEEMLRQKVFSDTLIQASPAFIVAISEDGRVLLMNDAMLAALGYSREEVIGKEYLASFVPPDARQQVERVFETIITEHVPTVNENKILAKDGSSILVEWHGQSFMKNNRLDFFIGVGIDITGRKQAEENLKTAEQQLIQADKMIALGTLVAGVAHEINNPNNFVMLNTPLIQEIWKGIVPVLEEYFRENGDFKAGGMPYNKLRDGIPTLLNGILDGSRRISTIVKELKDFARPDEVSMEQNVDINAAVQASLSLLHNMIAKSTHAFTVTYGENLPHIRGNIQRLEQVFINIIQNACQSLPDPGRGIHVATAYDGHAVSIIIRDEGTGIPQKQLGQLMDPFFTTKRGAGGTGLGLSISHKIISDHGGRIDVQSRVGEGSTFMVMLPLKPVKEKKKILIADDDEKQREIMYLILSQDLAYEIRMVENGMDACILLGKWRPDLILLDVNMPGMNGVDVCRRIKNDPDFSDIQVIIVTGAPDRRSMKDIQEMGFTDLCEKPFNSDQLQTMVAAALNRKPDKKN